MATPARLRTNGLSPVSEDNSTSSPARGRETRTALLQKLRPPQLVHAWDCWIEKPATAPTPSTQADPTSSPANPSAPAPSAYKPQLTHLHSITDIRTFWTLFNNLPLSTLPLRTSCHLFHKSVLPVWEDPRNLRGGAWIFRVPRASGPAFFTELALLAVGEQLQAAVADERRTSFRDDICGICFTPRSAAYTLVSVWNRDGGNERGVARMVETILEKVEDGVRPREGSYYYKKHSEHPGFVDPSTGAGAAVEVVSGIGDGGGAGQEKGLDAAATMAQMEEDVRKVRRILEEIKASDDTMGSTLAVEEAGSLDNVSR